MQQPDESPRLHRWAIVVSLTSSVGTSLGILFVIGLLLPEIAADLDLSPSEQGWLGSSVLVANMFFAIPANLLTSMSRPWRTMSLLFLGVGLFTLLQAWSPSLAVLIVGRIGTGILFTATQSPRAMILQQWIPKHRLAFVNGVIFAGIDLIMGLIFLTTPHIQNLVNGWRNTFYVWAGVSLALTAMLIIVVRDRVTEEFQERMGSQERTPLASILKYPQLWIMGLGMGGSMVAQAGFSTFWPTLAQNELGISASVVGAALGVMTFVAAPTDFLVNAVPTLVKRRPLVLAAGGLFSTLAYLGLIYADSTALVMAFGVLRGFSFAYFPVLMIMVYMLPGIKPREVGMGLAFMETSIWIGAGIGPLLVGFLQEATGDLQFALLVCAFSPLVLLVSAALLQGREIAERRRASLAPAQQTEA